MTNNISRRDFLKLVGVAPLGFFAPPLAQKLNLTQPLQTEKKNVLVIVFDAFSAYHISLYGYERETTPNMARLAKRAKVYHNHFAAGSFTTPGTASLLTMTLPWTHRAIRFQGIVNDLYTNKSVFHAFDDYYRVAYSHNDLVNILFDQFQNSINEYVPQEKLLLFNDGYIRNVFGADEDIATVSWARTIKSVEEGYAYSLYMSRLYENIFQKYRDKKITGIKEDYPYGLPGINIDNYYVLEQGIDWLADHVINLPAPFFTYCHFLPPHNPYRPSKEFVGTFTADSWKPLKKPDDFFTQNLSYQALAKSRAYYDEFILNVDSEFGRLFDRLESSGLLDNTWVVLTSDHGEMQERGISGHTTHTLYQPIIRVPLMIFEPGNRTGEDIYSHTSAVDVMTTMLYVTGHTLPAWSEGTILPPYNPSEQDRPRNIYTVQAKYNNPDLPLKRGTIMQVDGSYKLIYYFGYDELGSENERIQLFDIEADPQELNELSADKKGIASELLEKIKLRLKEADQPFQ